MSAAVLLAVAALLIAGCAPERDTNWTPVAWPVTGAVLSSAPAALAPAGVSLAAQRLRNDDVRIQARWSYLPGDAAINPALDKTVRDAVAAQSAASGVAYTPKAYATDAGLSARDCEQGSTTMDASALLGAGGTVHTVVACDIVRASGTAFGERLRIVRGSAAAVESDTSTVLYTDLAAGTVGTARDLFADPTAVWDDIVEVLRRDAGSLSLRTVTAPGVAGAAAVEAALATAVVVGDKVVLRLPDGFTAPELAGLSHYVAPSAAHPVYVALAARSLDRALTDFGRVIVTASGAFMGPADRGAGFDRVSCDLMPCMALTLDDGPSSLTPGFLDVLRDQHSAATFFMIGRNARNHPDTVRRVAAEGHEIGNHTWSHPYLTQLPDEQVRTQLGDTAVLLRSLSGQTVPFFRPPGGFVDARVLAAAGEPAILWSVDTRDWAGPADAPLQQYAIETPKTGTIMLMHDIHAVTSRVFPAVVKGLRDRGFSLVTLDTLFGGAVPPGVVRHGP